MKKYLGKKTEIDKLVKDFEIKPFKLSNIEKDLKEFLIKEFTEAIKRDYDRFMKYHAVKGNGMENIVENKGTIENIK